MISGPIVRGGPLLLGVNYRLSYGWDFLPGPLAVDQPERAASMESDFALLARHQAALLRWFVWNDGRRLIRGDTLTRPDLGPLQAGLDAAARHGLSVILVLLDHTLCFEEEDAGGGATKQGHGRWFKDGERFARLVDELLLPTVEMAAMHPAVAGIELINEPEMAMRGRDRWWRRRTGAGCGKVPGDWQLTLDEMRQRMHFARDRFRAVSPKPFSIGSMSSRWVAQWEECLDPARDFLTFHYYGQRDEEDLDRMLEERIAPLAERLPVGFGEFYPRGRDIVPPGRRDSPWPDHRLSDVFRAAQRHRLQLALPWVWNPGANDPGEIPLEEWAGYLSADSTILKA